MNSYDSRKSCITDADSQMCMIEHHLSLDVIIYSQYLRKYITKILLQASFNTIAQFCDNFTVIPSKTVLAMHNTFRNNNLPSIGREKSAEIRLSIHYVLTACSNLYGILVLRSSFSNCWQKAPGFWFQGSHRALSPKKFNPMSFQYQEGFKPQSLNSLQK